MILTADMAPEKVNSAEDAIFRLRSGDPEALALVLAEHHRRLFRYLMRMTQDPATAEDLFQQTWLKVMEKIGRFDPKAKFEPWLLSVAHNLVIDYLRRSKRAYSLDVSDEDGLAPSGRLSSPNSNPLDQYLDAERGAVIAEAIASLPAIHREVLSLRFEEEMKLEQIAEIAGIPLSTVKSRLRRALEGLRTIVELQQFRKEAP